MVNFPISNTFPTEEKIQSPALMVFPDIVKRNIAKAIKIAGNSKRLRPHVKTHKMPQIVQMHLDMGIEKFKCSTLSELKMVAEANADDILLAYPLVGPGLNTIFDFIRQWPDKKISVLVDNFRMAKLLAKHARLNKTILPVFIDIDDGMERTGIKPCSKAFRIYTYLEESPHLKAAGLHVYDGHIRESNVSRREVICNRDFENVLKLKQNLESKGSTIPELICGGTPTFPLHAKFADRTLSPGTYVLWDFGYSEVFRDLDFEHAAWLLTRVISKPGLNKLCLDLGHKALASEMMQPRVSFAEIDTFTVSGHSEEHLVIETEKAGEFEIGDALHAVPYHICPTVALYEQCYVIENGQLKTTWPVIARNRIVGNYE